MRMVLSNVYINGINSNSNIYIDQGVIQSAANTGNDPVLHFDHAIAFPGLINSHDHLDFNSFPLIGNRIYQDYIEWGNDIHEHNKATINAVLNIPKELRVQWSLYKNLLNGITTVVQHGEYFSVNNDLISVFQDCHSIHSVQEKRWKLRLNKPRRDKWPIVIHVGEGTNTNASGEINELVRCNLLRKKLVGIHGVAMNASQAKHFNALIWCPDANYFLLGATADIRQLKQVVPILFGTDSTLTGSWNIWEQLRIGLNTQMADAHELYDMLTATPAKVWELPKQGSITPGSAADIVIAEQKNKNDFYKSFAATNPEDILLVMHHGSVRLFDETLYPQLQAAGYDLQTFSRIAIGNRIKYVYGDLPGLTKQIQHYFPGIIFPGITIP